MTIDLDPHRHIFFALDQARLNLERALVLATAAAVTGTVHGALVGPITLQLGFLRELLPAVRAGKKAKAT